MAYLKNRLLRRGLVLLIFLVAFSGALLAQDGRVPSLAAEVTPEIKELPETGPAMHFKEPVLGTGFSAALKADTGFSAALKAETSVWLRQAVPTKTSAPYTPPQNSVTPNGQRGFHWAAAFKQSLLFLGVQHGYAMTQAKTRRELRGPFFKDYFRSVSKLGGWGDGGRFFTNYISHPMEGSIAGFIQIQNDPHGIKQEFGKARGYWTSRLKAMAWNAVYSTQFELGPISQSSLGNVGLHTSLNGKKRKMAYVDLVVTPTLGTAWLIGEDFLDRFLVQRLELKATRPLVRNTARVLLNPMRGAANLLRFKMPWYRDR